MLVDKYRIELVVLVGLGSAEHNLSPLYLVDFIEDECLGNIRCVGPIQRLGCSFRHFIFIMKYDILHEIPSMMAKEPGFQDGCPAWSVIVEDHQGVLFFIVLENLGKHILNWLTFSNANRTVVDGIVLGVSDFVNKILVMSHCYPTP